MKKIELNIVFIYLSLLTLIILSSVIIPINIGQKYSLIINPLAWTLIFLPSFIFNKNTVRIRNSYNKNIIKTVLIISLFYIIIYYLSGLIFGYLRTPYSQSLNSIIKNIWSTIYIIILQEYVRFILVNKSPKNKIFFVIISIFFIIVNIEFLKLYSNIQDSTNLFKHFCSTLLPLSVNSFLFTYLATHSSNISSSIYRSIPNLFLLLFPIIPDLNWFFSGVLEILVAFTTFMIINFYVIKYDRLFSKRRIKSQDPKKLIPFITLIIIFICFVAGFFKYKPIAVMSESMNPKFYKGDIVIINKLTDNEISSLKIGDIIEYKLDGKSIIHRIYDINDNLNYSIITKGDNNYTPDVKEVHKDQIVGKVVFVIPKLGYPTVWFNNILSNAK